MKSPDFRKGMVINMFREDYYTEFKRIVKDDLKKEVIAFANSDGGTIIIGVDDDGSIVGVDNTDEELLKITNMVRDSIKPDITMYLSYDIKDYDNKKCIVINIRQGNQRPYYISDKGIKPNGVYVRQGTASAPASVSLIRKLIKETDGERYENMRSFNQELTFQALEKEFRDRNIPLGSTNMKTLGLVNMENLYTNLGYLLSDQCTQSIKVATFQGTSKEIFLDRDEFKGSLINQLHEAFAFIQRNNKLKANIEELYRTEQSDYPIVAVREALLNAIVHRDYGLSASTLISILEDRLEIVSIGGLAGDITLNDILLGVSITRNEKLAGVFYRLKLIEAYGTGIAKIMDCYQGMMQQPKLELSDNAFRIVLPNCNYTSKVNNLNESEQRVVTLAKENRILTRKQVEQVLGVSQTMAGRILKSLIVKGYLKTEGKGIATVYMIRE